MGLKKKLIGGNTEGNTGTGTGSGTGTETGSGTGTGTGSGTTENQTNEESFAVHPCKLVCVELKRCEAGCAAKFDAVMSDSGKLATIQIDKTLVGHPLVAACAAVCGKICAAAP